jgi:hypothetical protein
MVAVVLVGLDPETLSKREPDKATQCDHTDRRENPVGHVVVLRSADNWSPLSWAEFNTDAARRCSAPPAALGVILPARGSAAPHEQERRFFPKVQLHLCPNGVEAAPQVIENIGAGEGNRTLVFSLEVSEFRSRLQQAFLQFTAFLLVEIPTEFALVGMMFELAVYWRQGTRTRTAPLPRQPPHLSFDFRSERST